MEQVFVDRVNSAGQGIGRVNDGRTIFVEGALPGEHVIAAVQQEKKNYIKEKN